MQNYKIKIIVATSKTDFQNSLKLILKQHFKLLDFYSEENGKILTERVREIDPDIVFIDHHLFDMSINDVCNHLKSNSATNHIPLVFIKREEDLPATNFDSFEKTIDGIIRTPFDKHEIITLTEAFFNLKKSYKATKANNVVKGNLTNEQHIATLNILEDLKNEIEQKTLTEKALISSESLYRSILMASPEGILVTDFEGNIKLFSPSIMKLTRCKDENLILNKNIFQFLVKEDVLDAKDVFNNVIQFGVTHTPQIYKIKTFDNDYIDAEIIADFVEDEFNVSSNMLIIIRDITERLKSEKQVKHLTRLYALTSHINQAVVRIKNINVLLRKVCDISITFGQFDMAFFSQYDEQRNVIVSKFFTGDNNQITKFISKKINSRKNSELLVRKSIIKGDSFFSNDITNDEHLQFLNEELITNNYNSMIIIPLLEEKKVFGSLFLFSVEKNFFNEEELKLMKDLANDLSFAINSINIEKQRIQTEKALHLQSDLQKLLTNISTTYINLPVSEINHSITKSLKDICKYAKADRAYIIKYNFSNHTFSNTHEWCAKGIESEIQNLQNITMDTLHDWPFFHKKGKEVIIRDINLLSDNKLKQILSDHKIKSLITTPMMNNGDCLGFVGFDWVKKHHKFTDTEYVLLSDFSQTLVNIELRRKTEEALNESQKKLRLFASNLQNIREDEKVSIAREIHDELGQLLVAIKFDLGMLNMKLKSGVDVSASKEILDKIVNLNESLKKAINTTRKIMSNIRPEILDTLGFVDAANMYINNIKSNHQINCRFSSNVKKIELNSQESIALYRILQESFNNIIKHSKAEKVNVSFRVNDKKVSLNISDNGCGFDESKINKLKSYGITGMRERAFLLSGIFKIKTQTGKGTNVKIEIPNTSTHIIFK